MTLASSSPYASTTRRSRTRVRSRPTARVRRGAPSSSCCRSRRPRWRARTTSTRAFPTCSRTCDRSVRTSSKKSTCSCSKRSCSPSSSSIKTASSRTTSRVCWMSSPSRSTTSICSRSTSCSPRCSCSSHAPRRQAPRVRRKMRCSCKSSWQMVTRSKKSSLPST